MEQQQKWQDEVIAVNDDIELHSVNERFVGDVFVLSVGTIWLKEKTPASSPR